MDADNSARPSHQSSPDEPSLHQAARSLLGKGVTLSQPVHPRLRKVDADNSAPPPSHQLSPDELGLQAARSLLGKGVKVALVKDSSNGAKAGSGVREYGTLSCAAADVKFAAQKPKVRFSTTYVSAIRDVELQQQTNAGQSERACRVSLREGVAGSSFSFVCTDAAGGLSVSELTASVTLVLKAKLDQLQAKKDSGQIYEPPPPPPPKTKTAPPLSTFEELLEPLGLVDKYCASFTASRIPLQSLSVVTGEDLAELVGVTDRLDQINIRAQIKRCFPDHPPCSCNRGRENDGLNAGVSAAKSAADLAVAIAGL